MMNEIKSQIQRLPQLIIIDRLKVLCSWQAQEYHFCS